MTRIRVCTTYRTDSTVVPYTLNMRITEPFGPGRRGHNNLRADFCSVFKRNKIRERKDGLMSTDNNKTMARPTTMTPPTGLRQNYSVRYRSLITTCPTGYHRTVVRFSENIYAKYFFQKIVSAKMKYNI